MKNHKLTIEYDGTRYHGWQKQKGDRTIQAEIERALQVMTGEDVVVVGSGRTDAGVHAYGQVAHFKVAAGLRPVEFQRGLNSLLGNDIVIHACHDVPLQFHARYDVKSKSYQYRILNRDIPSAMDRNFHWFIRKELNLDAMQAASIHLVGRHDFKSFEGAGSPRSDTVRTISRAEWNTTDDETILFDIEADGFLRYMVRNIVGTLVEVGLGKFTPTGFKEILLAKNRNSAGATAPPQGLFLMQVRY
jgi:tRNA pseudouridine38-40 synthase